MSYGQYDKMTREQKVACAEAARLIIDETFEWGSSPQGSDFWQPVYRALRAAATLPDVNPKAETHAAIAKLRKQIEDLERKL